MLQYSREELTPANIGNKWKTTTGAQLCTPISFIYSPSDLSSFFHFIHTAVHCLEEIL